MDIKQLTQSIIQEGKTITKEEALAIAHDPNLNLLCDSAEEIKRAFCSKTVDSCSIVNARSGMCGEDCKWCAQSRRHATHCEVYNFVDEREVMEMAHRSESQGVKRFSLVTSGKAVSNRDMAKFCDIYRRLGRETSLFLCASMGLIGKEGIEMLKDAGVKRYHCNLETSSSFFPKVCSTHTPEEKHATIRAAKEAGMEICSGGIIGMGENMEQRIDLAFELADLDVDSVPINILNPIPGTPLENQPLISEEDVIRTVAVFRFILPKKTLRFAGGRMRLSQDAMLRIMTGGMNGALVGDMLTTISNQVEEDRELFRKADMEF